MNTKDSKVIDLQNKRAERNATEILAELYRKHRETGECGIYDITPDGKLGEKAIEL